MASHLEKKNDYETTEAAVQPNVGSGEQEDSQNQEGSPIIKWSQEFNCFTVDGVLAPIPLSSVPLGTGLEDEQQQQPAPSLAESSSRRKRRTEGNEELFFRLFKFPKAGEQYLLEIHEPQTGGISRCHLLVYESNKRWKVGVHDLAPGDHVVLPMLEDPTPPTFQKKFEFSLQERLVGWTVEKRKRGNGKEDKFYYHRDRQFRSFVETAAFILYSSKLKDLELLSTAETSQVLVVSNSQLCFYKLFPESIFSPIVAL
ncbi:hypothetical protein Pfo_029283 [Paulownia fortunei]|nr:hypothetical protein Pfo_029283 [Paulownia fortunei]